MSESPDLLLVPVDGSEGANAAARYAAGLAERLGIPLRLLFAFPASALEMMPLPDAAASMYFDPETLEAVRKEAAQSAFAGAREALKDFSGTVGEQALSGQPAEAILKCAEDNPGAMIVMGRRGLSHVKEVLLGSVTQRVIHHATCPVLVVR